MRFLALVVLLLLSGCEVRRSPVEARSYVPDARSQAAGWMAYRAVCTPDAPRPAPPKVDPPAPKPAAPVKPKVQLNTFGLPVGVPPVPR